METKNSSAAFFYALQSKQLPYYYCPQVQFSQVQFSHVQFGLPQLGPLASIVSIFLFFC